MNRLTASQVANKLNISVYTLKRWYKWYENEDVRKLDELFKNGMPELPVYETIGSTNWRYWNEEDLEQLKKFKEFIPNTRGGFMGDVDKKKEEK